VYWLRARKCIAWSEISKVTTDDKRGEVKIKGRNGTKILFARQLPDRARLLTELEKHSEEKAPALKAVLEGPYEPEQLPAQLVRPKLGQVLWLVDPSAASMLVPQAKGAV